jgi:hypothetical protein
MTRAAILNAFSPAQQVTDPAAFAGRSSEIREVVDAMQVTGACPVIYGDKGLGKSSLAAQAQLIAMGDTQLLNDIGANQWIIPSESTFVTMYVTCTDEVRTFVDLQLLIIHEIERMRLPSYESTGITEYDTNRYTAKILDPESTHAYEERSRYLRDEEFRPTERLRREIQLLNEITQQPLLIIVDELDRAKNTRGLASFLKVLSGPTAKFLLVGIGQTLSDLHLDHPSLERQVMPIRVPRMTSGELADIVDRAVKKLAMAVQSYTFHPDARTRLVRLAGGFPWFVHVIGQAALLLADAKGESEVTDDTLIIAARELVKNRFAQNFKDAYQRAVRDSYQREIVLRVFAAWRGNEIPTSKVYPVCQELGVINPAVYRGHLTAEHYGEPLMAPGYQQRGLLRFRNEMFKQYVTLTTSLFEKIDEDVRKATTAW